MASLKSTSVCLPYASEALAGIGGTLKALPSHFVVEEIPLYLPSGTGEHVYVELQREGWNTRSIQTRLAALFSIRSVAVGAAGLKDKHARVRQTFSLHLHKTPLGEVKSRIEETPGFSVRSVSRHHNKLRVGHLIGNRFTIVVSDVAPDALDQAERIRTALEAIGIPNFYGAQRFGADGDNVRRGRDSMAGRGPKGRWIRRFLTSAVRSDLFNAWLSERMARGWFQTIMQGDIAKKYDTGGLFEVLDRAKEEERFLNREITYTGPMYGDRLMPARGIPGLLEKNMLEQAGFDSETLRGMRMQGTRRMARFFLTDLEISPHAEGLLFSFSLPKGVYATTVMREFMKTEPTDSERSGDE